MPMVTVEGSAVVVVADPDQLTIAETGCRGETHRVRLVDAASIGAEAPSGKAHPRTEGDDEVLSAVPETAEPFPLVLENALAREAVLTHDGVQPRLGGDGLPPTIVKGVFQEKWEWFCRLWNGTEHFVVPFRSGMRLA